MRFGCGCLLLLTLCQTKVLSVDERTLLPSLAGPDSSVRESLCLARLNAVRPGPTALSDGRRKGDERMFKGNAHQDSQQHRLRHAWPLNLLSGQTTEMATTSIICSTVLLRSTT